MKSLSSNVIIIGAGPAGCSASFYLSKAGISHVIVDKDVFPRDKICGDALSGKVTNQLRRLDPLWLDELHTTGTKFTPSYGVTFSSPNGAAVDIPFRGDPSSMKHSPGYISKRIDFDHFLFQKLDPNNATVLEGERVKDVVIGKDEVNVVTANYAIKAPLLISAEGAHSMVAKKYANISLERDHHCAGLRQYYIGVSGLHDQGFIELHFVREALPGYFWIFPLPNGQANVGIGMLSKYVSKHKVNLKQLMQEVIASEQFRDRFKDAEPLEDMRGWGLPLGSKRRSISGDRFILAGDAASLIDPFTGEGIGNAMFSGKWAAERAVEALERNDLSADFLAEYDRTVYRKLGGELRVSRILQKLIRFPWLFNWMIRKIKRNDELRETITFMFEDVDLRKKFTNPLFYLRVLFR